MIERPLAEPERAILTALTEVVLPSDLDGPGARDAGVADRIACRVATSPAARALYVAGLEGFDRLARRRWGRRFVELPPAEQAEAARLVSAVARSLRWTRRASVGARVRRRVARAYYVPGRPGGRHGLGEAAALWPQLCADAYQAFYTTSVAWRWLGYDGPPMSEGYPSLVERRAG